MNREIQLHDGELLEVIQADGVTSIIFSTAYIHESAGVPGYHPGLVWRQPARITIEHALPVSLVVVPPIWVIGGCLRAGQTTYRHFIPASGEFEGEAELELVLSTEDGADGGTLNIKGNGVKIELFGEASEAEKFDERPRRSIDED